MLPKMAAQAIIGGFITLLVVFIGLPAGKCHTFLADANLEKLLAMENDLIQLSGYLIKQESFLHGEDEDVHDMSHVNSTMEETKAVHTKIARKTMQYLSQPFNVYRLMKRLNEQWKDAVQAIRDHDFCKDALETRLENVFQNIPSDSQVIATAKAIVKLQYFHDLDIDKLVRGEVKGTEPLEPVTADEIFDIGQAAYEDEDYFNAIPWLQKATELFENMSPETKQEVSFNKTNTLSLLASCYYKLRRLSKAVDILDQLEKLEPSNTRIRQTKAYYQERIAQYGDVTGPPKRPLSKDRDYRTYERLCRGENLKSPAKEAKLKCFYHPTTKRFLRVKAEEMNKNPLVLVLHDVADEDTTAAIRHMGYRQMADIALSDTFRHSFPSVTVTDRTTWGWLDRVQNRYEELDGLLYPPMQYSQFEVRNFGMSGTMEPPKKSLEKYSQGGEVGNFVLFLKDVKVGGEIILPRSKTRITPEKGAAVFFYATQDYVGVCPTLFGTQWVSWKTYYERKAKYCRPTEARKHKTDY